MEGKMKLTPVELRAIEFKKAMRGDDPKEVKFYINQAADALEQLVLENKELAEKLEKYEKFESVIKEAALQSQETKKTQEEQAKKEAELIIEKAKLEAEKIRGGLTDLQNKRDLFFAEFKARLNSYLSLIEKEPKAPVEEKQEIPEPEKTPPPVEKEPETSVEEKETPEPEKTLPPVEKEQEVIKDEETPSPKSTEEDKPTTEPEKLRTEEAGTDISEETAIDEIQVNG